jgi:hypothetical protein
MKRYEVRFYFTREVCIEVDTPNGFQEAKQMAWDVLDHYPDEELVDESVEEINHED